jgi:hypothetical protein
MWSVGIDARLLLRFPVVGMGRPLVSQERFKQRPWTGVRTLRRSGNRTEQRAQENGG